MTTRVWRRRYQMANGEDKEDARKWLAENDTEWLAENEA